MTIRIYIAVRPSHADWSKRAPFKGGYAPVPPENHTLNDLNAKWILEAGSAFGQALVSGAYTP